MMEKFSGKQTLYGALEQPFEPLLRRETERFAALRDTPWVRGQVELVRKRGEEYLSRPTPVLSYQLFRLYWEDGNRDRFEDAYFDKRGRLLVFSLLCWLEPEREKWLHALEDILWDICAEPFWCIPAHLNDFGGARIEFERFATHLDLFSSETGFAIAETLELCGERLAPDVARQAKLQLHKRVFAPFLDGNTFYKFEAMPNNWAAVCGGAIGGAALYQLRDPAALASVLSRCLGCMQVYLDSFGDDGVSVEGVGYWTYGFGFYVCFSDLLKKRTGGRVDLLAEPKAAAIAKTQQLFYLCGANTISFSDGYERAGFRMGLSCYLQGLFPDAAIPDAACAEGLLDDRCSRYCLGLRDLLWYDPQARFGLPAESASWLPDAQWFISRSGPLALAAKAGHNGESHNHNDCGSFLLCKDGVPLLCDLGAGLYNAEYFGPNRYGVFVNASRSHSLPLVAGAEQVPGADAATADVAAETEGARSLSMELSGCYRVPALRSLRRVIEHRTGPAEVVVSDTFEFDSPQPVTEVFVSRTPIRLEDGCAVLERGGASLRLTYSGGFTPRVLSETYFDHYGAEQTAYLLHLSAAPAQRLRFEAKMK